MAYWEVLVALCHGLSVSGDWTEVSWEGGNLGTKWAQKSLFGTRHKKLLDFFFYFIIYTITDVPLLPLPQLWILNANSEWFQLTVVRKAQTCGNSMVNKQCLLWNWLGNGGTPSAHSPSWVPSVMDLSQPLPASQWEGPPFSTPCYRFKNLIFFTYS